MSIVKVTRRCGCGRTFKVDSRSKVMTCLLCGMRAARAAEEEHAARVAAMPVPTWAEGDPFVGVYGQDLSVGLTHTGNQPFRAVKP